MRLLTAIAILAAAMSTAPAVFASTGVTIHPDVLGGTGQRGPSLHADVLGGTGDVTHAVRPDVLGGDGVAATEPTSSGSPLWIIVGGALGAALLAVAAFVTYARRHHGPRHPLPA